MPHSVPAPCVHATSAGPSCGETGDGGVALHREHLPKRRLLCRRHPHPLLMAPVLPLRPRIDGPAAALERAAVPRHINIPRCSRCHPPPVPQPVTAVTVLCCSLVAIPTSQQPQHSGAPPLLLAASCLAADLLPAPGLLPCMLLPFMLLVWRSFLPSCRSSAAWSMRGSWWCVAW